MDLTAETIKTILDVSKPEIHNLEDALGRKARYSTKQLFEVKAAKPEQPAALAVFTLAGFADLVRARLDGVDFVTDYIIHVEDFRTVSLRARLSDEYGRRQLLVQATPVPFDGFKFGRWIDQEEFAIGIASQFADAGDKDYVLNLAASLVNEATRTTEDNGFNQRVTTKAGLAMKQTQDIKPRVALAPFRTFPEVQQPVSEFVFRAKAEPNQAPALMLVEADGGAWKVQAIAILKAALEAFDLGVPIIA